jgi:hypothetical protein
LQRQRRQLQRRRKAPCGIKGGGGGPGGAGQSQGAGTKGEAANAESELQPEAVHTRPADALAASSAWYTGDELLKPLQLTPVGSKPKRVNVAPTVTPTSQPMKIAPGSAATPGEHVTVMA